MRVSEETALRASCDTNPLFKKKTKQKENVLMNSCWFQLTDSDSAKILNQTHLETHSSRTKTHVNNSSGGGASTPGPFCFFPEQMTEKKFAIFPHVSLLCSQRTSKAHILTGISLRRYIRDLCGGGCALLRGAAS